MALFGRTDPDRRSSTPPQPELPGDSSVLEELSGLIAREDPRELNRTDTEVRRVVDEAARADIRGLKLLREGRCPQCQARTESLLLTQICPACGWFRRGTLDGEHCRVYLESGETLDCDRVFRVQGEEFLCVRQGVVICSLMRNSIRRIDYLWSPEELEEARKLVNKQISGICAWCESDLTDGDNDGPIEEYVAFAVVQERFVFCSEKCLRAFRKQFPSRIHRNCYETECRSCNQCVKRYDTSNFIRHIIP